MYTPCLPCLPNIDTGICVRKHIATIWLYIFECAAYDVHYRTSRNLSIVYKKATCKRPCGIKTPVETLRNQSAC